MSELKEYHSSFTGQEVDSLLTKVKDGSITADIEKELAEKADAKGRYPDMSVGFADDLVGRGESVPAEFSFRASGGKSIKDGTARIKRLKGNSVVWNNMVDTRGYEGQLFITTGIRIVKDHKYLLYRTETNQSLYLIAVVNGAENYEISIREGEHSGIFQAQYSDDNGQGMVYSEAYCGACIISDLTLMFGAGNEPTTIEEYNARKPIVADEYAYNEGEVIHCNTESIKSVGDNAWDEEWELGYINPGNGNESDSSSYIRSKNYCRIIGGEEYYLKYTTGGDDSDGKMFIVLYDENHSYLDYWGIPEIGRTIQVDSRAQYFKVSFRDIYGTTYKNDVMISLMHSGWKADTDAKYQPYWEDRLMFDKRIKDEFPDGMSKWDAVYNKNGKGYIVHGLGVEDMGNMSWWYDNQDGNMVFISWGISDLIKKPSDAETNKGALSAKYSASSSLTAWNMSNMTWVLKTDGAICIDNETYNDAESFKSAMAGVMLYYQLAEPIVIEYDEPFNLDYKVADFGTEEIIAPQPSAPISADIIYQFNAVDMIREHELEITELQRIIATMQAQLTSLISNNNN